MMRAMILIGAASLALAGTPEAQLAAAQQQFEITPPR